MSVYVSSADRDACLNKTVSFLKIRPALPWATAVVESPEDIAVDMLHNSPHRSGGESNQVFQLIIINMSKHLTTTLYSTQLKV